MTTATFLQWDVSDYRSGTAAIEGVNIRNADEVVSFMKGDTAYLYIINKQGS